MQTLKALHENAHLANLDVSCGTVMLHPGAHPWDCVKLVGFSAAQRFSPGIPDLSAATALCFSV